VVKGRDTLNLYPRQLILPGELREASVANVPLCQLYAPQIVEQLAAVRRLLGILHRLGLGPSATYGLASRQALTLLNPSNDFGNIGHASRQQTGSARVGLPGKQTGVQTANERSVSQWLATPILFAAAFKTLCSAAKPGNTDFNRLYPFVIVYKRVQTKVNVYYSTTAGLRPHLCECPKAATNCEHQNQ